MSSLRSSVKSAQPASSRAPYVAVVGQSARMLAQSAARAGLNVVALDLFGDRDTLHYARFWFDVGEGSGALKIDRERILDALERVGHIPHMLGWIAGSGLEPLVEDLYRTPHLPRWIGNSEDATTAVRDPQRFFALLDELDIAHPAVSFARPAFDPAGWLVKHAAGCGGTHIESLDTWAQNEAAPQVYFQRVDPGQSMSALFIAAHQDAVVIGFARQLTVKAGNLPFVHAGSIGPVDLPDGVVDKLHAAIDAIVSRTGLTGLNSIDFLLDGESFQVLEINARPSSTMALYETVWPEQWPRGLIACHIDACLNGKLPDAMRRPTAPRRRAGQRVLFAPYDFTVTQAFSDACLDDSVCHDVPQPGTRIETGQPVCTLVVTAPSVEDVPDALERERERLLHRIETSDESHHDAIPG
ncbi:ATP-grasp domain-containing protein [Paraburkholderia sp. GAS334]|uniref:ATP-grasp domain-containing protein n=1 Tax=Paraburkholderia sp. GAS334 TaxID=3035131 RepID=UPI003D244040